MTATKQWLSWGFALAFFSLALLGCDNGEEPSPKKEAAVRHLLIVSLDTTRADRLGPYGYPNAGTPRLDELAREGTTFERAQTTVPVTLPAHASLMTGNYPPTHGVRNNGIFALQPENQTLAETLHSVGFDTAAFVGARVLDDRYGLNQGFEHYDQVSALPDENGIIPTQRRGDVVVDQAIDWLSKFDGDRFFAFVHLFDPHAPYEPPPSHASEDPYQGEIAFSDSLIGRLIDALKSEGLADDTLIVITADHGEGLGDRNERTHGLLVYQSTMHIPLIFRGNGFPSGHRVTSAVSLIDVAPTVLSWLGVEAHEMEGRDLGALIQNEDAFEDREIYFESHLPKFDFGWSPLEGFMVGRTKFIQAPRPELYDLKEDPAESRNLLDENPRLLDGSSSRFRTFREELERGKASFQAEIALSDQDRKAMEELGYLSGGATNGESSSIDPKDCIEEAELMLALQDKISRRLYAEVRRDAARILELNPANVYTHEKLAQALNQHAAELVQEGRAQEAAALQLEALASFDRALALQPDRTGSLFAKAMILFSQRRYAEAEKAWTACTVFQPRMAAPYRWLGILAEARQEPEEAVKHYRRFLEEWKTPSPVREDVEKRLARLESEDGS